MYYAESMSELEFVEGSMPASRPVPRAKGPIWKALLVPRPRTLVAGAVYLLLLIFGLVDLCVTCSPGQKGLLAAILFALLALEQLDYALFGEDQPPLGAAIALLAVRVVLLEAIVQLDGIATAMWAYLLLPYVVARYFGAAGAIVCGLLVWVALIPRVIVAMPGYDYPSDAPNFVAFISYYTAMLVFASTTSAILLRERTERARAERLLAELERSGRQRKSYAEQALLLTDELGDLARAMHEDLSRHLNAVRELLDGVLAQDEGLALGHKRELREAKQEAAVALRDVRRSVSALRAGPSVPQVPVESGSGLSEDKPRSRWAVWLAPRPFDAVITAVYLANMVSYLAWRFFESDFWSWHSFGMIGIVLALLVLDRIDYWLFGDTPPRRVAIVLFALRLLLIVLIVPVAEMWWASWFLLLLPYHGFVYFGKRAGYAIALVLALSLVVAFMAGAQQDPLATSDIVLGLLRITPFWLIILVVAISSHIVLIERARRERAANLTRELRAELEQLQLAAAQALAAVRERNHLAREIHDGLGHYLTVINVQLEKALAFREVDPGAARQALRDAHRMTIAALEEVRSAPGTLHATEQDLSLTAALGRLVENLSSEQLAIATRVEGSEDRFAQHSLAALYRAAQEGLTNVQKHAGAGRVLLELDFGEDTASLSLTDDGRGFDPAIVHDTEGDGGYGLQGLRERLELAGGRLVVDTCPGAGTRLTATIPRTPPTPVVSQA